MVRGCYRSHFSFTEWCAKALTEETQRDKRWSWAEAPVHLLLCFFLLFCLEEGMSWISKTREQEDEMQLHQQEERQWKELVFNSSSSKVSLIWATYIADIKTNSAAVEIQATDLKCQIEFNPEKLCSEMKGTSGGLNQDVGPSSTAKSRVQRWKPSVRGWTSGLSSTPKSCVQRWKVTVGGWARMWVPVQLRKVGFRDESHQWGVEPWVWVQPRKVVPRDEGYQWGVEPGCGSQFNPEK